MIYSHRRTLSILHNTMSILNLIIVLFYGTVILLTTRYIISSQLSRDFLDNIDYIPHHPLKVFFWFVISLWNFNFYYVWSQ